MGAIINRRREMGGGGGTLPYDKEVAYLAGDGHQYIQTSIVPNSYTGIKIKVTPDMYTYRNENDSYICGTRTNTSNTRWGLGKSGTTAGMAPYYMWGRFEFFSNARYEYDTTIELELNFLNSQKAKVIKDTATWTVNLGTLGFIPVYGIRLFGSSGVTGTYTQYSGKIHYATITQGNDIIADFIPVVKDNVGYMYDKVSGQLFGNAGTGSFILGPDK